MLALLAGVLPASAVDYGRYRYGTYSPLRDTLARPALKNTLLSRGPRQESTSTA
jgi:hypothetical protein